MIDYDLIEKFRALDTKEAKTELAKYANDNFSVKLIKTKTFDNMLADLKTEVDKIPVQNELVIDVPIFPEQKPEFVNIETIVESAVSEPATVVVADKVEESKKADGKPEWLEGFSPKIVLIGASASSAGYYTCPWWIFDWIQKNSDWKENPEKFMQYSARETLKSLAYYVYRDGCVVVRETRNSKFVVLR